MNLVFRFIFRLFFSGIFWVFVLSMPYKDSTVFSFASNLLVKNQLVEEIYSGLDELWDKVYNIGIATLREAEQDKKAM